MSEFCFDCIQDWEPEVSPKLNGLRHKQRGELAFDVCEGCGEGWFDWEGKRHDDDKEGHHDTKS